MAESASHRDRFRPPFERPSYSAAPTAEELNQVRRHLEELPYDWLLPRRRARRRRAETITEFVCNYDQALARGGLDVARRAALVVAAHNITYAIDADDWNAVAACAADIATVMDAYPVDGDLGSTSTADPMPSSRRSALRHQLQRLWQLCNTDGVTLAEAVDAASHIPSDGGHDAPTR